MKRILIALILLSSAAIAQPNAYVVNSLAETMSKIDLTNGYTENHVTVLGDVPNDIAFANNRIYVVNSVSASLQIIDPLSYTTISDIPLPIGSNPYSVTVTGDYAYVSGWVTGDIYRIDLSDNSIDNTISIGGYPEGMLFYDGMLFVTQTAFNPSNFSYGQGRLATINTELFQLSGENNVGCNPQSLILEDRGLIHVVCTGNYSDIAGSVYIFNPYTDELDDSLLIGGQPVSGVITRNGIGYLAAGGWVDHGIVMSYDIHSRQILHGISNPIQIGLGATDLALDSSGNIYAVSFGNDNVAKLDSNGEILATYQLGDGPQAIAIWDDGFMDNIGEGDSPSIPERSAIRGNYPNPFNANTMIEFELSGHYTGSYVAIYDLQGRIVRKIYPGTAEGKGVVSWDGRTDNGAECASGIYLAGVTEGSGTSTGKDKVSHKMMLVR